MKIRGLALAGALLASTLTSRPVEAAPILGAQLFATGGNVVATFLGSSAAFTSELFLFSANDLTNPITGVIFNNHTSVPGTSVNLGNFAAGTELVFGIRVINTGFTYFTGPASRNPDGIFHASVEFNPPPTVIFDPNLPPVPIPPGVTLVGFEDIFGGGDLDFNDLGFAFTSVAPVSVPEPSALLLLGGGVLAHVVMRQGKRRS